MIIKTDTNLHMFTRTTTKTQQTWTHTSSWGPQQSLTKLITEFQMETVSPEKASSGSSPFLPPHLDWWCLQHYYLVSNGFRSTHKKQQLEYWWNSAHHSTVQTVTFYLPNPAEISFLWNFSEIRSANSVLEFVTNLVLKYLDTRSSHLTLQESMSYAAQILSLNLYCRWRNWTSVVCEFAHITWHWWPKLKGRVFSSKLIFYPCHWVAFDISVCFSY